MKSKILGLLAVGLLAGPVAANATVTYSFDFSNIECGVCSGDSSLDFNVTLTFADYIQTTGKFAAPGSPISTPLGLSVTYVGTDASGWWLFDDDGPGDGDFSIEGSGFFFRTSHGSYFTAPGSFSGDVSGSSPATEGGFRGVALLTITESSVPEPGTLALLGLGLAGLGLSRRRKAN